MNYRGLFLRSLSVYSVNSLLSTMRSGLPLKEVINTLETIGPLKYAEKWDNVGLLLEPPKENQKQIKTIFMTNDLTENVLSEAIENDANLIITYHPLIFKPLTRLTQREWKHRIITKCIANSIAVYSPHTIWDTMEDGVNDWLAKSLQITTNIRAIEAFDISGNPLVGRGRIFSLKDGSGGGVIIKDIISSLQDYIGSGGGVQVAYGNGITPDSMIETVAVCAGSGASVLRTVHGTADLFITGEMSHHEILDATHSGITVILCNHSNSERGFLKVFQARLKTILKDHCEVLVSQCDMDPLTMYKRNK